MAPIWSDTEQAYLLNHLDYCLENDKDFRSSAPGVISRFAKRELSFPALNHKLSTLVNDNGTWTSLSALISNGTSQLDLAALPSAILSAMKTQRSSLGLGDLDANATVEVQRSETLAPQAENNNTARIQRRLSPGERNASQNSYCEEGVADSENSDYADDANDGDFHLGQKAKPELTVKGPEKHAAPAPGASSRSGSRCQTVPGDVHERSTASKRKSDGTDPTDRYASAKRQALDSNVPPSSFSSAVSTLPKRKADVIVLDEDEQPSLKRQARDTARAPSPFKMSGIPPHVKCTQRAATLPRQSSSVAKKNDAVHAFTPGPQSLAPLAPLATHQAPNRTMKVVQQPQHSQPAKQPVPAKAQQAPAPQPTPSTLNREAIQGAVSSNPTRVTATYTNPRATEAPATSGDTTLKLCQDLSHLVGYLMYEHASASGELNEDVKTRLELIQRFMKKEPGSLYGNMLRDLRSRDLAEDRFRNTLFGLITHIETNGRSKDFPVVPLRWDLEDAWKALRRDIYLAFGTECTSPVPELVDAGYVAARINDLAKDGGVSLGDRKEYLEQLAPHLKSPHLAQSILSAMFCRWLLSAPDSMCKGLYFEKEKRLYDAVLVGQDPKGPTDSGAKEVQKLDKLSLKLMFADEDFEKSTVRIQAERLAVKAKRTLAQACPSAPGFHERDPLDWAKAALKLKQILMISPKDYRVHFPFPGTDFDPTWMKAEEFDGFALDDQKASEKKVACCLFPALFEKDPQPFKQNVTVEEILTNNKAFFPSFEEKKALDPKRVIGKATVLVL